MAETMPIDVVNVINLCCMCLKETKLEVLTTGQFEFLEFITQFQINSNDIHQACSGCLTKLDDFATFCRAIRSSINGFIDLFKNIIVSDDERQDTTVEFDVASELIEYNDEVTDEPAPSEEVAIEPMLASDSMSSEDKARLLKPEIRVETLDEKIQRVMADSSNDEMNYVVECLEEPKRTNKNRLPKRRPELRCETCGKTFDKLSRKVAHVLTHTDLKMYACSHKGCDRRFKSKMSHKEHESSHTGEYPMFCAFGCGRGFHSKASKQNHEAVHTDKRPFECELCDKRYILKRALDDHYRRQHISNLAASLSCEICGKLFRLKSALSSHLRTHSDERRFQCQQCPLTYKHSSHLRDHEKTHQEAQHICPICDAKFVLKQSLKRHLRYHEGVKNNRCTLESCNKSFVEKCDLVKHMRTHTGFKPYVCSICGLRFSNKEAMVKHHQVNQHF